MGQLQINIYSYDEQALFIKHPSQITYTLQPPEYTIPCRHFALLDHLSHSCPNHFQSSQLPLESTPHIARICCGRFLPGILRKPCVVPDTSGGYGLSCSPVRR